MKAVRYQAAGAGHYVVLDGAGEERDYVFMHLATGTTLVREGQTVTTGQQLAQVGNTGRSFGAHLHFEIWDGGGWYTGGKPIDPLPLLKAWAAGRLAPAYLNVSVILPPTPSVLDLTEPVRSPSGPANSCAPSAPPS